MKGQLKRVDSMKRRQTYNSDVPQMQHDQAANTICYEEELGMTPAKHKECRMRRNALTPPQSSDARASLSAVVPVLFSLRGQPLET